MGERSQQSKLPQVSGWSHLERQGKQRLPSPPYRWQDKEKERGQLWAFGRPGGRRLGGVRGWPAEV